MEQPQTYQPGDIVFDENASTTVQILEKLEARGFVSYRVYNSGIGQVYKVSPVQFRKDDGTQSYNESYLRYVTLLVKIKNETDGGLLSSLVNGPPCRLDRRHGDSYNRERIYAIINCGWDLIIIDEAHRVAGSSSDMAQYNLYDA